MEEICNIDQIASISANGYGLIYITLVDGREITSESEDVYEIVFKDGIAYKKEL